MSAASNLHDALRAACADVGILFRDVPADGRWHATDVDGDRHGKGDGRIKVFADGEGGIVSNWKGETKSFFVNDGRLLTDAERRERDQRRADAIRKAEAEDARRKGEAATKAAAIWKAATPVGVDHPYLTRKDVAPVVTLREISAEVSARILGYSPQAKGEPLHGRLLIVPVKVGDELSTCELIDEAGRKSAIAGGAKRGGFWCAQPLPEGDGAGAVLMIGEGAATVLSAREATGHYAIAALSCGNLAHVARAMRELFPAAAIVILADIGNGESAADEAAHGCGGRVARPDFGPERDEAHTDFNDLHVARGPQAVRACVEAAIAGRRDCDAADEPDDTGGSHHDELAGELARLAALPVLQYEQVRQSEAERLGVRVGVLDSEVSKARKAGSDTDDLQGRALEMTEPEPWGEPVDGAGLLDEIVATIRRFAIVPDGASEVIGLWVLMSYAMDVVTVAPILAFTSPEKQCGKTTCLAVVSRLARLPLPTSNVTPSALFRAVEKWAPTLLIDEADTFMGQNEELRGIVNSGHTRSTAFVVRCVGDDQEPRIFSTWGAKAIAAIGHLPDTVMDRALEIRLRRALPDEQVENVRRADKAEFERLRRMAARWTVDNKGSISGAAPSIPDGLSNRAADNAEPLLAIADRIGGVWPERARAAVLAMIGRSDEPSIGSRLLADIVAIFDARGGDRLATKEIITGLCDDDTAPWAAFDHGRPITPRQLARRLGAFGLSPKKLRVGVENVRGYDRAEVAEQASRYAFPQNPSGRSGTPGTSGTCGTNGPSSASPAAHVPDNPEQNPARNPTREARTPRFVPDVPLVPHVPDLGGAVGGGGWCDDNQPGAPEEFF